MAGGERPDRLRPDESQAGRDHGRAILYLVPLCLLFGYALLLEVAGPRRANYDEHLFVNVAQGILRTGLPFQDYKPPAALFFDHTPLYSYLIAIPVGLGSILGGSEIAAARATTALFGFGTIALVFLVGRDVRGNSAGFIAAGLVALNPYWIRLSWFVHMEVPMTFFLVAGLYLLVHRRILAAGLAVALAVLTKEIALAFWVVAGGYVLVRHGPRRAAAFATPAVVAIVGSLVAAAAIDPVRFSAVMDRWVRSVGGSSPWDERFRIGIRAWTRTVTRDVLGPALTAIAFLAAAVAVVRRRDIPPIAWLPAAYCVLVVAGTYAIKLKEDRWLTSVVPMLALAIVLLVDWVDVAQAIDGRRPGSRDAPAADDVTAPDPA